MASTAPAVQQTATGPDGTTTTYIPSTPPPAPVPAGPFSVGTSTVSAVPGSPYAAQMAAARPAGGIGIDGFGPIMSGYLNQFNKSIGASRAQINTHLQQALGELGQRRDAAAQVVAGLPGEIAGNTAVGQAQLGGAAKALGGLDPGAAGQIPVGAGALQSALVQGGQGYKAMVPGLNLANMANAQGGEAMLKQQAMIGQQGLDDQQRQFMSSLMMNQLQNQESQQAATSQDARYRGDLAFQNNLQAKLFQQQEADAAANQVGLSGGQKQLNEITQSPAYQYAKLAMSQGLFQGDSIGKGNLAGNALQPFNPLGPFGVGEPNNNPGMQQVKQTPQQIIDKYKTSNPDILRALAAEGLLPQSKVASALGVGAAAK